MYAVKKKLAREKRVQSFILFFIFYYEIYDIIAWYF